MATLSMTPDSCISSIRSLPSRVRSPTPEKTDTPPCWRATLWISSVIVTVLPTPAPPKRPTLPPRTNGATRSMTLMPVSKISIAGERSPKAGGSRWIGQRSPFAASLPSTGSPITFQIRPSVCSPTGTEIGPCVSTTSTPRASPSVESMATARTRSSPRCCCTSAISSREPPSSGTWMLSAWLISGSRSGKTASSTTPLISTIFPVFLPLLLSATESPLMLEVGAARGLPQAGHSSQAGFVLLGGTDRVCEACRHGRDGPLRGSIQRPDGVDAEPADAAPLLPADGDRQRCLPPRGRRRRSRLGERRPRVVRARLDDDAVDQGRRLRHLPGPPRLDQHGSDGLLLLRDRARGPARVRPRRAARAAASPPSSPRRGGRDGGAGGDLPGVECRP